MSLNTNVRYSGGCARGQKHNKRTIGPSYELWQCYYCSRKLKKKASLIKHVAKHMEAGGNGERVCELCSKRFRTNRHLRDHVRRNHLYCDLHCYSCSYSTKLKFLLEKHVQKHLDPLANPPVNKYSCLLCKQGEGKYECAERQFMLQHYARAHEVHVETVKLHFQSIDKFNSWKAEVEKVELCRYVSRGGVRRTPDCNIHWFRCFRDGVYRSKSTGKRKLKNKGSLKINSICPSSIRAVEAKDTGSVQVNYIPVHVGHGKELELVNLSIGEKKELAEQLAANIPFDAVLASLRTSLNDSGDVERIHLTTRKDLWNIKRSFNVSTGNSTTARSLSNEHIDDVDPLSSEATAVDTGQARQSSGDYPGLTNPAGALHQIPGPHHVPTKHFTALPTNCQEITKCNIIQNSVGHLRISAEASAVSSPGEESTVRNWITKSEPNIVRFYESQAPLLAENPENDSANYVLSDDFNGRKKALIDEFFKLLDSATTEADLGVIEVNFSTFSMDTQQELYKNRVETEGMVSVVCQVPDYA